MANKTYTVMKDGDVLKELKTLAAAKRLADQEDAEVFDGGLCVYAPDPEIESIPAQVTAAPAQSTHVIEKKTPIKYRLTHRMNVRTAPSMEANKVRIEEKGAVVKVTSIEDDWLHLTDGNYILYGGGKFAEKV